jgi:hypothetical protein
MFALGCALLLSAVLAFRPRPVVYEFMTVSMVESLVPGGMGRSRIIATNQQGKIEEGVLKNFFSLGGINFENLRDNDLTITRKLGEMTDNGWELVAVTNGSVSPGDNGAGIYLTRYLFKRPK